MFIHAHCCELLSLICIGIFLCGTLKILQRIRSILLLWCVCVSVCDVSGRWWPKTISKNKTSFKLKFTGFGSIWLIGPVCYRNKRMNEWTNRRILRVHILLLDEFNLYRSNANIQLWCAAKEFPGYLKRHMNGKFRAKLHSDVKRKPNILSICVCVWQMKYVTLLCWCSYRGNDYINYSTNYVHGDRLHTFNTYTRRYAIRNAHACVCSVFQLKSYY